MSVFRQRHLGLTNSDTDVAPTLISESNFLIELHPSRFYSLGGLETAAQYSCDVLLHRSGESGLVRRNPLENGNIRELTLVAKLVR